MGIQLVVHHEIVRNLGAKRKLKTCRRIEYFIPKQQTADKAHAGMQTCKQL